MGILLALAQGSPLHAQSSTQTAACQLEGPSIADTLKYINDELGTATHTDAGATTNQFSLAVSGDNLIFTLFYQILGHDGALQQRRMPLNQANCHPSEPTTWDNGFKVLLKCDTSARCVQCYAQPDGTDWERISLSLDGLELFTPGDKDHADRMGRALSHLIALLQQQYKQSHSDPNDPFAKPQ